MALPGNVLSTGAQSALFRFPRNSARSTVLSYEYGGAALNDTSQGLRAKIWTGVVDGAQIALSAPNAAPFILTVANPPIDFDFTFDQNMTAFIAYELTPGNTSYYWYDTTIAQYVTSTLPAGSSNPRCAIDDSRDSQSAISDILFSYVRAGTLFYRQQRDRYTIERSLVAGLPAGRLMQIGMTIKWRFQFQYQPNA